MVVNCRV